MLEFWQIIVFMTSIFVGSISITTGLTMWIMGKLSDQDARRTELKEAILKEIRDGHQLIYTKIDFLNSRIHELALRLTRVETQMGLSQRRKLASDIVDDVQSHE